MSGFDLLLVLLQGVTVWVVVKWLMVVALGLYGVFAVVVIRQVQLMSRTLNGALELPLRVIAYTHLGVAVAMLVLALVIL
ncbi:MAG: hypothetical protein HY381_00960 [Candidatus Chisholmbacteria bacterium]|nr:hypothetical protein [Candidatus Chisholmbacteria bacterium]